MEQQESINTRLGLMEVRLARVEERVAHITDDNQRLETAINRLRQEIKEDLQAATHAFGQAMATFDNRAAKIEGLVNRIIFTMIGSLVVIVGAYIAVSGPRMPIP